MFVRVSHLRQNLAGRAYAQVALANDSNPSVNKLLESAYIQSTDLGVTLYSYPPHDGGVLGCLGGLEQSEAASSCRHSRVRGSGNTILDGNDGQEMRRFWAIGRN